MEFVKRIVRDQKGAVESTLVIIPLLALFLITMELIVAVNYRNLDAAFAQSDASMRAITHAISAQDEVVQLTHRGASNDLRLLITHQSRILPRFMSRFPMISGDREYSTEVVGVAVMERNP